MNDQKKSRFAVDLDEIERQLRLSEQSAPQSARPLALPEQQAPARLPPEQHHSWDDEPVVNAPPSVASPLHGRLADPLSELARIVGQNDPFDALLAAGGRVSQSAPDALASNRATPNQNVYNTYGAAKAAQVGQRAPVVSPPLHNPSVGGEAVYPNPDPNYPQPVYPQQGTGYTRQAEYPQEIEAPRYTTASAATPEYGFAPNTVPNVSSGVDDYETPQDHQRHNQYQQNNYQYNDAVDDFSYEKSDYQQDGYDDPYAPSPHGRMQTQPGLQPPAHDPFYAQNAQESAQEFSAASSAAVGGYGYDEPFAGNNYPPAGQSPSGDPHGYPSHQDYSDNQEFAASAPGHIEYPEDYHADYDNEDEPRSRKPFLIAGLLSLLLIGGGSYYFMSGGGVEGDPPLISAQTEPVKIIPEGGDASDDSENHGIYGGSSQNAQVRVIDQEEQPVDIETTVRVISPTMNGSTSQGHIIDVERQIEARDQSFALQNQPPNRVRSLSVRADGTVIFPEENNENTPAVNTPAASENNSGATASPDENPAQVTDSHNTGEETQQTPAATTTPSDEPERQPETSTTVQASNIPRPQQLPVAETAPRTRGGDPLQLQPPRANPTVAQAGAERTNTESSNYTVQLGIANSEGEAKARFEALKRRFPGELSGSSPIIRKAEVNGTQIYRIRVGAESRNGAHDFCARLSSAGGDCFVSRN